MTQRDEQCWQRLASVISWSDMTINHFARHIGLSRSEALYQIKRGNNGLSRKMAELIVTAFPQIDLIWLLSGRGDMFVAEPNQNTHVDLYEMDVELFDGNIESLEPSMRMVLPASVEADFAMRYFGSAMSNTIAANSIVLLRQISCDATLPGGEYVVVSDNFTTLRVVRRSEQDAISGIWRLVATSSGDFDDIFVRDSQIKKIYRVVAKLIINR